MYINYCSTYGKARKKNMFYDNSRSCFIIYESYTSKKYIVRTLYYRCIISKNIINRYIVVNHIVVVAMRRLWNALKKTFIN